MGQEAVPALRGESLDIEPGDFVTYDPRTAECARRLIHIYDGKLVNGDGVKAETGETTVTTVIAQK